MVTSGAAESTAQLSAEQIVYYAVVNSLEVTGPLLRLFFNWQLVAVDLTIWWLRGDSVELVVDAVE